MQFRLGLLWKCGRFGPRPALSTCLGGRARRPLVGHTISLMPEPFLEESVNSTAKPKHRGPIFFPAALTIMLGLFAFVVLQRDRLRAHYWAYRLVRADDLPQRAQYLNGLLSLGGSAAGAVEGLAEHESPDVRLLALAALRAMPEKTTNEIAGRLVFDPDREVREAAALTLAFSDSKAALRALYLWARSQPDETAAAAVAALARCAQLKAAETLCGVLSEHPSPLVRAQAAESLAEWLGGLDGESDAIASLVPQHDPFRTLVEALSDEATFDGLLALERDIAAAAAFVQQQGYALDAEAGKGTQPAPSSGTHTGGATGFRFSSGEQPQLRRVGDVAAEGLARLTGEKINPTAESPVDDPAAFAEHCRGRFVARARASAAPPR